MRRSFQTLLMMAALVTMVACEGAIDVGDQQGTSQGAIDSQGGNGGNDVDGDRGASTTQEDQEPPFQLERTDVRLLPFHVRMQKLSGVLGTSTDDPVFDELRANRYDLGDHNYAQGIGPDLNWNASKMALWVESLLPICRSEAMQEAYPYLPEHLNELLTAAYGREATQDDLMAYEDVLSNTSLTEEKQYETICLAVLSSTEFVAQ